MGQGILRNIQEYRGTAQLRVLAKIKEVLGKPLPTFSLFQDCISQLHKQYFAS